MNLLRLGRVRPRAVLLAFAIACLTALIATSSASATSFAALLGGSQAGSDQDGTYLWTTSAASQPSDIALEFAGAYWPHMHKIARACSEAVATTSSCVASSRMATVTAVYIEPGSILPVVRTGYIANERKRSGELMGRDVLLIFDQNARYSRYVGRRRVEVLKSNKTGDPNARVHIDLGAPPRLVRRDGTASSATLIGLTISTQQRWMRLPTSCAGGSSVSAISTFADGSVETVMRSPNVTGCGSLTVDSPLDAQFNPREYTIDKPVAWKVHANIGDHADGESNTDAKKVKVKMMGSPKIGEATRVFTVACTTAQADAAACPEQSRLGQFCVESSPAGEVACGDVWNAGVRPPGSAGGGAGGSVGLLFTLTKFAAGGGGADGLLWVGAGSVEIVPGTGESILTIDNLPQADLHALRMTGDNPLFEPSATCGTNPLYVGVQGWSGAARDRTLITAVACTPGVETTDHTDDDSDGDGIADNPLRPAEFHVDFAVTDRGDGIDSSTVSCAYKGWNGKVKGSAQVADLDGDGLPDRCYVTGAGGGEGVLELRAADHKGHVTLIKRGFDVDATPPEIAIDEPGVLFTSRSFFDVFTEIGFTIDGHRGHRDVGGYRCATYLNGDYDGVSRPTSNCAPAGDLGGPNPLQLKPGHNHVTLVVQDPAGNMATAFFDVFYDPEGPKIVTTEPVDEDCDGRDGAASVCYRQAFFDVFYSVGDAGAGVDWNSNSCAAQLVGGAIPGGSVISARVVDSDGDGRPDRCRVENAPDGRLEVAISAADDLGNVSVLKRSYTVDSTAPAVQFFAPGSQPFDGSSHLWFSVADANPGHSVCSLEKLDNHEWIGDDDCDGYTDSAGQACDPTDPTGAGECRRTFAAPHVFEQSGRYRATVVHVDKAGNTGTASIDFTVDVDGPAIALRDGKDQDCEDHGDSSDPSACFRPAFFDVFFTATDAGSGVDWSTAKCRGIPKSKPAAATTRLIDDDGDGVPEGCHFDGLEEDEYDVEISVADLRGHVTVLKLHYSVDTTPPAIAIDEPGVLFAPSSFFDVFADLGLSIDDLRAGDQGLDGYRCDFNLEGDFDGISRPTSNCAPAGAGGPAAEPLKPGLNHAQLKVMDPAGNISVSFFDVFNDIAGPVITLADASGDACDDVTEELASSCYRPAFFDVFFTATDAGVGVDWSTAKCRGIPKSKPAAATTRLIDDDGDGVPEGCHFDGLEEDEYDVEISVADWRGHVTVLKLHYSVDTTPPEISIDEPGVHFALDSFFDVFADLGFTIDGHRGHRDVGGYRCATYLNGDYDGVSRPTSNCAPAGDLGGPPALQLKPGLNHVTFVVEDPAGNMASAFFDVFYDVAPPRITPDPPGSDDDVVPTKSFGVGFEAVHGTFSLSSSEASMICWIVRNDDPTSRIDGRMILFGGQADTIKFSCQFSDVPDGEYDFHLVVTDAAGLDAHYDRPLTVDTVAPEVSFFDPGSEPFGRWPPLFFSVQDANPGSSVCSVLNLDTGAAVGGDEDCDGFADSAGRPCEPDDPIGSDLCRRAFVMPHVLDSSGRYRATVVHTDLAGHVGRAHVDFSVDADGPVIALRDGNDQDCEDHGDSSDPSACFRPAFFDVFFTATDAGSGVDWSTATCRGIVGKKPGSAAFGRMVDGNGDGVPDACHFDGLQEDQYDVEISVADWRGHVTVLKLHYSVDTTPPVLQFKTKTTRTTPSTSFGDLVRVSDNNGVASVRCGVATGAGAAAGAKYACSNGTCAVVAGDPSATPGSGEYECVAQSDSEGLVRYKVVATDLAGNSTTEFFDVFFDRTAPTVAVVDDPDDYNCDGKLAAGETCYTKHNAFDITYRSVDESFAINSTEPSTICWAQSLVGAQVPGASVLSNALGSAREFTCHMDGLPDGEYVVHEVVKDAAGNASENMAPVTVDTTPPVIVADWSTIDPTTAPGDALLLARFDVSEANPGETMCELKVEAGGTTETGFAFACEKNVTPAGEVCDPSDASVSDCRKSFVLPHVLDQSGRYTATITHTDRAGNRDVSTHTFDLQAPTPTIAFAGAPTVFNESQPTIPFTIANGDAQGATLCEVLPEDTDEVIVSWSCGGLWSGSSCDCAARLPQPLPNGTYRLQVTHSPGGSRESGKGVLVWSSHVDLPVVTAESFDGAPVQPGQALVTTNPEPIATFSVSEPATTVCALDETADGDTPAENLDFKPCSLRVQVGPNAGGGSATKHWCFRIRATDSAGNTSDTKICFTITRPSEIVTTDPLDSDDDGDGVAKQPIRGSSFDIPFDVLNDADNSVAQTVGCDARGWNPKDKKPIIGTADIDKDGVPDVCRVQGATSGDLQIEIFSSAHNLSLKRGFTVDADAPRFDQWAVLYGSGPTPGFTFTLYEAHPGTTSCSVVDPDGVVAWSTNDCIDYLAGEICETSGECRRTYAVPHVLERSGLYHVSATHTDLAGNTATGGADLPGGAQTPAM